MKPILKFNFLFLALAALFFTACEKEDLAELTTDELNAEVDFRDEFDVYSDEGEMDEFGRRHHPRICFDLIFPVTVIFLNDSTITAEDEEELRTALRRWKVANPDAEERPEFEFPVQVERRNGNVLTIDTQREFMRLVRSCPPNRGPRGPRGGFHQPKECFDLIFPVTISFPDGSTTTVEDNEALREALRAWKEANPDAEERPEFVFPIDVILEDGTTKTIESAEAFRELLATCGPLEGERPGDCFDLIFPVTINFPDGSSVTVESEEELKEAIRAWRAENPGNRARPTLALPVDVTLEDGTTQTITTEEELRDLLESCRP